MYNGVDYCCWQSNVHFYKIFTHWHLDHTPGYIVCGMHGCRKICYTEAERDQKVEFVYNPSDSNDDVKLRFMKSFEQSLWNVDFRKIKD